MANKPVKWMLVAELTAQPRDVKISLAASVNKNERLVNCNMLRNITRILAIAIALMTLGVTGCGGSGATEKLETPDGIDWAALEKQEESLASEMSRSEK